MDNLTYTKTHIPVSFSIFSNVEGFNVKPIHVVNNDPRRLIELFVSNLLEISKTQPGLHSRGAVTQRAQSGNFNRRHLYLFISQGMLMDWQMLPCQEQIVRSAGKREPPPPNVRPPWQQLWTRCGEKEGQCPRSVPPLLCHVTPASRDQQGPRRAGAGPEPPRPDPPACRERPGPGPRGAGRGARMGRGPRAGGRPPAAATRACGA
jgi:hypothetical protein